MSIPRDLIETAIRSLRSAALVAESDARAAENKMDYRNGLALAEDWRATAAALASHLPLEQTVSDFQFDVT